MTASASAPESARRGSFRYPGGRLDLTGGRCKGPGHTRQEAAHRTLGALVVSSRFGIVLGSADIFFNWLIERTLL